MTFKLVSLILAIIGIIASASAACTPSSKVSAKRPQMLIPMYMYPESGNTDYSRVSNAAKCISITAIVNPANGPGRRAQPDSDTIQAFKLLKSSGVFTIGYVYTKYGKRNMSQVKADVQKYAQWPSSYGVQGIFFDEVSNNEKDLAYYEEIYKFTKSLFGAASKVINNPGTNFPQGYICRQYDRNSGACLGQRVSDTSVAFESSNSDYNGYSFAPFMSKLARSELAILAYETGSVAQMKSAIDKSVASNIGYVYVTDKTLASNPWDGLPTYFEQEVDYIASI